MSFFKEKILGISPSEGNQLKSYNSQSNPLNYHCTNCGASLRGTENYCGNCGIKLKDLLQDEKLNHKKVVNGNNYHSENDKRAESEIRSRQNEVMPLKWFKFIINFSLPIGILIAFSFLIESIEEKEFLVFLLSLFDIIIFASLIYGVHTHKKWAWGLLIFTVVVLHSLNILASTIIKFITEFGLEAIILGFFIGILFAGLWAWPNWIYFRKRKYLIIGNNQY